jgi:hypothetical protein
MARVASLLVVLSWGALAASLLRTNPAQAEPSAAGAAADVHADSSSAAAAVERPLRLSVGTGLTLGLSDVEESRGDQVDIGGSAFLLNLSVAGSYQLSESWALGARGSLASDSGARAQASTTGQDLALTRNLWQFAGEGRYQPGGMWGGYAALNAGAALATDAMGSTSASQWAPLLGSALGYDVEVAPAFALGLELRGGAALFGSQGATLTRAGESATYIYGPSSWLSLNLTGHVAL